jgi:serine protease Do
MSSFPWRCLLALVATWFFSALAAFSQSSWDAVFPGPGGESGSTAFPVGDGRYFAAVALSEMQADAGRLRSSGRELPAEVFVDPVSKLVVFHVSGPAERALPLAASGLKIVGTELQVKGSGTGKATGWVKQLNGKMLPLSLLKIEYSTGVPKTGTPLMDSSGAVVAIAHQTTSAKTGYALPVDVVKRVLEDVQGAGRVSRGWIGLKLLPGSAVPQVTNVQEGSPCAVAGVRSGDVLLEVGSRRLADYADAVNAFYYLRPGITTPVRLKRGAQEISITVTPVEKK